MLAGSVDLTPSRYIDRIGTYLAEMFPVPQRLISSFAVYFGFRTLIIGVFPLKIPVFSLASIIGGLDVFLLLLMLRLMDELKDRDIDKRLFSHRPLPSGRVKESDIRCTLLGVIIAYLGINLWARETFWMAALVLAYALLMFRYFFIPRILRSYLLLNLATHNPILPLMFFLLALQVFAEGRQTVREADWFRLLLLVLMYWSMTFAWEIARKIKSREEETEYVTYSRIFGPVGAVATALGAQTLTLVIGLHICAVCSLSIFFAGFLIAGYILVLAASVWFLLRPSARTSRLKPWAECYILLVASGSLLGVGFGW